MKPPAFLDSAKVLYWAWSGDTPFGVLDDGQGFVEIFGLAVCILAGNIYSFSCDQNWNVQNDLDWTTPQEAMKGLTNQYPAQQIQWEKYDDTDIDALMVQSRRVMFYQEVGERRVIQKIVAYLQQHHCDGMDVQLIENNIWVLSIQAKDVQIASEFIKSNIIHGISQS